MYGSPSSPAGPLRALASNPGLFADATGKAVFLAGSHTWDDFTDQCVSPATPSAFDFTAFVSFLTSHGHNCTILWRWDQPKLEGLFSSTYTQTQFPWARTGPGTAVDGLPKFDLNTFDQSFFDRLRSRVQQLNAAGIYVIVMIGNGESLNVYRNSASDGFAMTAANNINGIADDGLVSSYTMTATNSLMTLWENLVKKFCDTLHDQTNVIWELSEEAPGGSATYWHPHLIDLIHTYEAAQGYLKHPVLYSCLEPAAANDTTLYNSNADCCAPIAKVGPTSATGTGTPTQKVIINDGDHSYFGMWNDSAQTNRNVCWQNLCAGCGGYIFMDPYLMSITTAAQPTRNVCVSPTNGICTGVDTRWENFRTNLGQMASYGKRMNLAAMTSQSALASTGQCLAHAGSEYLVYCNTTAHSVGFTVDLSASAHQFAVEWYDPVNCVIQTATNVAGGSATTSFHSPFVADLDAVLYLKDTGA